MLFIVETKTNPMIHFDFRSMLREQNNKNGIVLLPGNGTQATCLIVKKN